jgi:transcriptional regulator with XRE-family HTH domain
MRRLQRWLDDNGMNQRELAERCGVSPGLISQYINGVTDPSIETLKTLAKVTGLSTDELLFGDSIELPRISGAGLDRQI